MKLWKLGGGVRWYALSDGTQRWKFTMPAVGRGWCRLRGHHQQGQPLFTTPDPHLETERRPSQLMSPNCRQAFYCLHDTFYLMRLLLIMLVLQITTEGSFETLHNLWPTTATCGVTCLNDLKRLEPKSQHASVWLCPMANYTESQGPTCFLRVWLWFSALSCLKPRLGIQNSKENKSRLEDQHEGSSITFWNPGSKPKVGCQKRVSWDAGSLEPGSKWTWLNSPDSMCQLRARVWLGTVNAQAGGR